MSDHLNQGLKLVITETAITAGTYQIFEKFNHNRNQHLYLQLIVIITINSLQKRVITINKKRCKKKQSVFKVAILRMLKFAQSAEYAQKNEVKSLPMTHMMVERSFPLHAVAHKMIAPQNTPYFYGVCYSMMLPDALK